MSNHKYYAELGVNAAEAVKAFGEADKSATGLTNTLTTLGTALEGVGKTSDKAASKQGNTLKLYQQLASAAGTYGRAMKTLNDPAVLKGTQNMTTAMKAMQSELNRMKSGGLVDKSDAEALNRTLGLYKSLASASATYTSSLRNEAAAIKSVADAETRRQQVSKSAANAATRGTDGWGVTKDERDQRAKAQVQMQARRQMESDFAARKAAQDKATAAQEKGTAATKQATGANTEHERGLASTRYALYEVAAAYTAVSAAMAALPVASIKTAIDMEQQFAHVARTTQAADAPLAALKNRFADLSTEIPITFEELSKIGTLGAQMGIATGDLETFADTVAKFSATTNVNAEQASMSFGRLANMMHLTQEDYLQLGSSISELGTASVATESEILAIAESIATTANMAGFSADEVVGLSTAMASLRIRPEMARGAMQRIFASINAAVADGTEKFGNYADALGVSTAAAEQMYRNDPSEFLMRISKAIGDMDDNVARSQFIREGLGLRNVRDVELLNRLSNGFETYADSMTLAQDAYARGDYLDAESGVIFETTAAHLERLSSALKAMLASFGNDSLAPINALAEALIWILNGIRDLPTPAKNAVVALALIGSAVFALKAAIALGTASMFAFRMMMGNTALQGGLTLKTLRDQAFLTFPGMKAQIDATTGALVRFNTRLATTPGVMGKTAVAARGMGAALGAIPIIGWVALAATAGAALYSWATAHDNAATAAKNHADEFIESSGGMASLIDALKKDAEEMASGAQSKVLGQLNVVMKEVEPAAETAADALRGTLIPAHDAQADSVRSATAAYQEGIGAIGEYTDAWMREGLANKLSEVLSSSDVENLLKQGFDFDTLMAEWQSGGAEGAEAYVGAFRDEMEAIVAATGTSAFGIITENTDFDANVLAHDAQAAAKKVMEQFTDLDAGLDEINSKFLIGGELGVDMFDETAEGADEAAEAVEGLSGVFDELLNRMFDIVDTQGAVFSTFEALGKSLDENGNSFNAMSAAGRSNLDALKAHLDAIGKDITANVEAGIITAEQGSTAYAQHVTDVMQQLSEMGVDTSQFEEFITGLDKMMSEPVRVAVDTNQAMNDLMDLARFAERVLANIAGNRAGTFSGGVAKWGQGVASTLRNTASGKRVGVPQRVMPTPFRDMQTLETERARAAQERLNKEKEKGSKSTKDTAEQARKLRKEIEEINDPARLFEETMKELSSAFKETLDDFNGLQSARDSMESQLLSMRDAAQAAVEKVSDLREEAAKLRREAREERVTAEQSSIFARVAGRYGDNARKNQYSLEADQANAAAKEKDRLAKAAANEAAELDKNKFSLTGYSKQAIENRGSVMALQQEMADLIIAYAETGASTKQVSDYAERLRRRFIEQVTQMGYNRSDVVKLSGVFKDLKGDIDRVPREVRIKARADTDEARRKIRDLGKSQTVPLKFKAPKQEFTFTGGLTTPTLDVTRQVRTNNFEYGNGKTSNSRLARGGVVPGSSSGKYIDNMLATGHNFDGTVAVRSGEGIVNQPALNRMGGEPWLNAVNSMKMPPPTVVVSGGGGSAANGVVDLSPRSLQLLAQQLSTSLFVDGKVIQDTANRRNTSASRRGAN